MLIFEKTWFKWLFISSTFSLTCGIAAVFFFDRAIENKERLEEQRRLEQIQRAYEEEFRSTMVRVYHNLRLGHFLAAYKNLEEFEAPASDRGSMHREYWETVARIAEGLLENDFLDESEALLKLLQSLEEFEEMTRENLIKIASARRYDSARRFMEHGVQLLNEKKYIDAANEFRKAKLEFDSVALYGRQNIEKDLEELLIHVKKAKFHLHLEEGKTAIAEAHRRLEAQDFEKTQKTMASAAAHVGRAAYYGSSEDSRVTKLRQELKLLKSELSFRVPNSLPTFNRYKEENLALYPNYFYLKSAEFDFQDLDPNEIDLSLQYQMKSDEQNYYLFRYRTYFYNGKMHFNGKLITESEGELEFKDELPESLRGQPIKRIDVSVYNQDNVLVSRYTRAYRRPGKE